MLKVSEDVADFLPPKFDRHGGWLLYRDMPHQDCPAVVEEVKVLQRRLGLLRFPIGNESNIYAPEKDQAGKFETRTLSAVRAFQQHAAEGKAFEPAAWPPGHTDVSDGKHEWWFVTGKEVDVAKLDPASVIPACADEKTWAAIDDWLARKVRKPGMILVKNPVTYMRWDAALAVYAWKKLVATFGVHYPQKNTEETELASQYSLADLDAGLQLTIAHPHKTGHALDFGVVTDVAGPLSDWAKPRANWPIVYEGQWFVFNWYKLEAAIAQAKATLAAARKAQKDADATQKQKAAAEATAKTAFDEASALEPPDPRKKTSTEGAHRKAVTAREQADKKLADANTKVQASEKAVADAEAKLAKAKNDPEHRGWAIHFRMYGHSKIDLFGNESAGFDELAKSVDGMTAGLKKAMQKEFGDTPPAVRDAFLDEQLAFLDKFEQELEQKLAPANAAGRASVRATIFRATVRQWLYNPYSRAAGKPGDEIKPSDTKAIDYLDAGKAAAPNVPPGAKSFVNLTYLGWICKMYRIAGQTNKLRDPHEDGELAPRQKLPAVKQFFGKIVGLVDRMSRADSDEKKEPIELGSGGGELERYIPDLDLELMKRWARALPAMRPKPPKGTPVVVTTSDPQVTIELSATDAGFAQIQTVLDKLSESGSSSFVLVDVGKSALLDAAILQESGKAGLVEADKGTFDTGASWRAKIENVATLFKDKVAAANVKPDDKAPKAGAKKAPTRSEKRDPKEWQITLQPVFERTTPVKLDAVAFQPNQWCELPTPGHGEPLEWWHYQHDDSVGKLYPVMLKEIGYAAELLFHPKQPDEVDQPDAYPGRGIGANPVQEKRQSMWQRPKAPENGDTDVARVY